MTAMLIHMPVMETERLIPRGRDEAARLAHSEPGRESAIGLIDTENRASSAVAERLGAKHERSDIPVNDFNADIHRHLPAGEFPEHAA